MRHMTAPLGHDVAFVYHEASDTVVWNRDPWGDLQNPSPDCLMAATASA